MSACKVCGEVTTAPGGFCSPACWQEIHNEPGIDYENERRPYDPDEDETETEDEDA